MKEWKRTSQGFGWNEGMQNMEMTITENQMEHSMETVVFKDVLWKIWGNGKENGKPLNPKP